MKKIIFIFITLFLILSCSYTQENILETKNKVEEKKETRGTDFIANIWEVLNIEEKKIIERLEKIQLIEEKTEYNEKEIESIKKDIDDIIDNTYESLSIAKYEENEEEVLKLQKKLRDLKSTTRIQIQDEQWWPRDRFR